MPVFGDRKAVGAARRLRREMTRQERALWRHLRGSAVHGLKFRRQEPVGRYIADFLCIDARLIVEVDGGQHAWSAEKDASRTRFLEAQGFKVLRFWNNQVDNELEAVLETIRREALTRVGRI